MHVHVFVESRHIRVRTESHTHTQTQTYICPHTRTHTHMQHTRTHTHMQHTHTQTHTCTHTRTDSAAVAQNVRRLDRITATRQIPSLVGGKIVALRKPSTCAQISVIVRTPDTYYNPVPTRKMCSGSCPPGQTCTPFKTVIRNFKVLVFRRFNCWGVFIWLPIGTRSLCITDEFNCQCKPKCKPLNCFPPRRFNPTTCDCECPKKFCKRPFALDPSSCQCRCPKNIVCLRPKILNFKTCECVCPNTCKPPFILNPRTCRCICRKRCPRGAYLDRRKCQCVGDCKRFRTASDCNRVDSCSDNRARKCR